MQKVENTLQIQIFFIQNTLQKWKNTLQKWTNTLQKWTYTLQKWTNKLQKCNFTRQLDNSGILILRRHMQNRNLNDKFAYYSI